MPKNTQKNITPDKKTSQVILPSDELKKFKELSEYFCDAFKKGHEIEAFLVAYQLIQEMEMPKLSRLVLKQLRLHELEKKLLKINSAYTKNMLYVTLTHDTELYVMLEEARETRNALAHKIVEYKDMKDAKKVANKAMKGIILNIFDAIQDRWNGKKGIPVLGLYAKGWNDCRAQMIKNINL